MEITCDGIVLLVIFSIKVMTLLVCGRQTKCMQTVDKGEEFLKFLGK